MQDDDLTYIYINALAYGAIFCMAKTRCLSCQDSGIYVATPNLGVARAVDLFYQN
jgi:hypothetical protein